MSSQRKPATYLEKNCGLFLAIIQEANVFLSNSNTSSRISYSSNSNKSNGHGSSNCLSNNNRRSISSGSYNNNRRSRSSSSNVHSVTHLSDNPFAPPPNADPVSPSQSGFPNTFISVRTNRQKASATLANLSNGSVLRNSFSPAVCPSR